MATDVARERVSVENHSSHSITIGDPEDTLQYLAAVEEDWKLILRKSGRDATRYHVLHSWDDEPALLHSISEDPSEQNNLAGKHPDQVQRLEREIESRPKP